MFDIGFSELFLIAIVALIVLGPERLPKAARFAGLWMRRARAQWYSVKSEFENELADDELKRSLQQTRDELRDARDSVLRSGEDMQREFAEIGAVASTLDETPASAEVTQAEADAEAEAVSEPRLGSYDIEEPPEPSEAADDEPASDTSDGRDAKR